MSCTTIREARGDDAVGVSALLDELGYPLSATEVEGRINEYLKGFDSVLVADDQGEVVGFVSFHVIPLFHATGCMGRITAMCVSSHRKREGIGRALLTRLDELAAERACSKIEVTSGDHRVDDAHVFYESCGYSADCRRFQKILNQGK